MTENTTEQIDPTVAFLNQSNTTEAEVWSNESEGMSAWSATLYASATIGVVGNLFVLATMLPNKAMRNRTVNRFIINQSFVDFLASVMLLATWTTLPYNGKLYGFGGDLFCRLWISNVFIWCLFVTSTYNVMGIALDRYLKIVHPLWYKASNTRKLANVLMMLSWAIGFGFNFLITVPTSEVHDNQCLSMGVWPSADLQVAVGILTTVVEYFLPMAGLLYLYGHIAFRLGKQRSFGKPSEASSSDGPQSAESGASGAGRDRTMEKAYRGTLRTMFLVSLFYVICWTGNQVFFFLYNLGMVSYDGGWGQLTQSALVYMNPSTNPFIYLFSYKAYREYVVTGISSLCGRK